MTSKLRPEPEASEVHRDRVKRAIKARTRVEAVLRTGLIESALAIPALNRAVRLTARALRAPIAQINLISDTAFVPIATHTDPGEDVELWRAQRQPGNSFCKHVLWSKEPFRIEDAAESPLVKHGRATRELGVRAYLGAPIHAPTADGGRPAVVGTVCVIDREPRVWTDDDVLTLSDFALGITDFIAARVRTRADVRAGDQQFSLVLGAVGAAVVSVDGAGVITYANDAASRMLGYSFDQLVGRNRHELIHHTRADGSRFVVAECSIAHARERGVPLRETGDIVWRNDGTPIAVDTTIAPVFDRGEVVGAVLTLVDVIDREQRHGAERQARLAAEAASRAKTALLHAMSDELRAPLEDISRQSARLEAHLDDTAQLADVHAIQRSQAQLLSLADTLAGFANIGETVVRAER